MRRITILFALVVMSFCGLIYALTLRLDENVPKDAPCRNEGFLLASWKAQNMIEVEEAPNGIIVRVVRPRKVAAFLGPAQYKDIAMAAACFAEARGGVVKLMDEGIELGRIERGVWSSAHLN
jgi:hypothetical protein